MARSRSFSDFDEFDDPFDDELDRELGRRRPREVIVRRAPSPGIAAVLSVLIPGLGQVYSGRLVSGALWFLATSFCYWAILLPGFLVHALCIWSAWRGCPRD